MRLADRIIPTGRGRLRVLLFAAAALFGAGIGLICYATDAFRSVELSTGVRVIAPNETFEKHVKSESIDGSEEKIRLTTVGKVVGKRVGKSG